MAKLIEATYGDALFELAVQESKVDALFEEAKAVMDAFRENEELGKLLNHPKVEKEEKETVIKNIFSKFVSDDMTGLLVIMVAKDRQNNIIDALEYFVSRVLEYKKIGIAYVCTAKELTESQKKAVVSKLLETTEYKDFQMNYTIDESLIGGMVIRIGDRVVDSSIQTKLAKLTKELSNVSVS